MPTTPGHVPTYYEILSLSPFAVTSQDNSSDPTATAHLIKRAYRRALLNHHPDKKAPHPINQNHPQPPTTTTTTRNPSSSSSASASTFTIDQISTAYATLSRPALRQAYDRTLLLRSSPGASASSTTTGQQQQTAEFQTGIETVDLDDLDFEDGGEDETTKWYRSCRCGNPRGYQFTEADLEDAADLGELMVGCADCSLWLRVHFAVVDDDSDQDGDGQQRNGTGGGGGANGGAGNEAGVGER